MLQTTLPSLVATHERYNKILWLGLLELCLKKQGFPIKTFNIWQLYDDRKYLGRILQFFVQIFYKSKKKKYAEMQNHLWKEYKRIH